MRDLSSGRVPLEVDTVAGPESRGLVLDHYSHRQPTCLGNVT